MIHQPFANKAIILNKPVSFLTFLAIAFTIVGMYLYMHLSRVNIPITNDKVTLYNENFKPDDYQIGLLYSTNEGNKLQFTSNVLRVDSLHAQLLTRP